MAHHYSLTIRELTFISWPTQPIRYINAMLVCCWASVADGGSTLNQYWFNVSCWLGTPLLERGGGLSVVVSTAAFHARARGLVPGLGCLKETKDVSSPSTCESQ